MTSPCTSRNENSTELDQQKEDRKNNFDNKKDCILHFEEKEKLSFMNTPVYRVYPICHLVELFNNQKNTLVKPCMWDDPFENLIFQKDGKTKEGGTAGFYDIRERLYGQCWTLNKDETDALWRIYSPGKNGVRVKTTLGKLWDSFYDLEVQAASYKFFIGKIRYMPEKDLIAYFMNLDECIDEVKGIVSTLLFKRCAFSLENEIRLIYFKDEGEKSQIGNEKLYKYGFNPISTIDSILFDPRFDEGMFNVFKSYLIGQGFKGKIEKSTLYQPPKCTFVFS